MENCPICKQAKNGLINTKVYGDGLFICVDCNIQIRANKGRHYSKIMERYALLETGYHANRKLASSIKSKVYSYC